MTDPRVARLGELVVNYSLGLEPGKVLRIDAPPVAEPLAVEVYRAALAAGAHPYVDLQLERLPELLLAEAKDEQLDYVSPIAKSERLVKRPLLAGPRCSARRRPESRASVQPAG